MIVLQRFRAPVCMNCGVNPRAMKTTMDESSHPPMIEIVFLDLCLTCFESGGKENVLQERKIS